MAWHVAERRQCDVGSARTTPLRERCETTSMLLDEAATVRCLLPGAASKVFAALFGDANDACRILLDEARQQQRIDGRPFLESQRDAIRARMERAHLLVAQVDGTQSCERLNRQPRCHARSTGHWLRSLPGRAGRSCRFPLERWFRLAERLALAL